MWLAMLALAGRHFVAQGLLTQLSMNSCKLISNYLKCVIWMYTLQSVHKDDGLCRGDTFVGFFLSKRKLVLRHPMRSSKLCNTRCPGLSKGTS